MKSKKKGTGSKNTIYVRYEFSDEKGTPEGGDTLRFSSIEEVQEFTSEILEVAHGDQVSVNLTIGREKPFFGFLGSVGLSREDAEKEIVDQSVVEASAPQKASKKSSKKASSKKAGAKAKKK